MKSSSTLVVVLALVVVMMAAAQENPMPMMNTTGMPDMDTIQKMMQCTELVRMQKGVTLCLKEFYQSFRANPKQDCPQAVTRMMPACINATTRKCFVEAGISEAMMAMIPNNGASAMVNANTTAMFCSSIVPVRIVLFTTCSQDYYMSLGLCVLPFQQKFNANKGDPALCEAYDVQNTCMMAGAQANCDATEYRNISTKFSFLGEKKYNPFCSDSQVGGTAATLAGGTAPTPAGGTAPTPTGGTAATLAGGTAPTPAGGTAPTLASGMLLSLCAVLFGVGTLW